MKALSARLVAALLAVPAAASASGTAPAGNAEPPVVPYLCDGGRTASIVYRGGSDYLHAGATVSFDGRRFEMRAAPTLSGIRYRGEAGDGTGAPLAWSLRGEEARLTESPAEDTYIEGEREIARCVRRRGAIAVDEERRAPH